MPYALPFLVAGFLMLYYLVDPIQSGFPIQCPWKLLTNTQCPSCGFQRSLHAFMHGEILSALSYNYFFVLSIPYALLAIIASWYNFNHMFDQLRAIVYHPYTLRSYAVLYLAWWVLRNLLGI